LGTFTEEVHSTPSNVHFIIAPEAKKQTAQSLPLPLPLIPKFIPHSSP
jgi:hypothetical protein